LAKKECFSAVKKQLNLVAQHVDLLSIDKPAVALAAGNPILISGIRHFNSLHVYL
jgi:hypothetical protein